MRPSNPDNETSQTAAGIRAGAQYAKQQSHLPARATKLTIFALCCMFFGIVFTEHVSNIVLPLTLRKFTDDPKIIGLILALNPAFGFLAQPVVGLVSDRVWTRLGRRVLFIVISAPIVATCLVFLPFAMALWQVVVLVVVYQFFEDILFGSDQPLLADVIPPAQRSFVASLWNISASIGYFILMYVGLEWVERYEASNPGEHYGLPVYWMAAFFQIVCVMGMAFCIKERKVPAAPRPRLTLRRYISDFAGNRPLFRLMGVNFARSFQASAIMSFMSLYAIKTLLFTEGEFGKASSIGPILGIAVSLPIGWVAERMSKSLALQIGFVLILLGCAVGFSAGADWWGRVPPGWFLAGAPLGLLATSVILGLGMGMTNIVHKAFITEFFEPDIVGQTQGVVNVSWALGRTLAMIVVPWFIFVEDDYTPIWVIAGAVSVINMVLLVPIKDERYATKRPLP